LKTFIFGLDCAWFVAPEREGAHNWEGSGHFTAVRSLTALMEMCQTHFPKFMPNLTRVIYDGHSRGGHGALVMATHR
jgi:hypothetical protein